MDKLLGVLMCKDLGYDEGIMINPETKYAVTALVFNAEGKIALINHTETDKYELPSYDDIEISDIDQILKDNLLSTTGTILEFCHLLGSYEERRSFSNTVILSKVYLATVKRDKEHPVYKDKLLNGQQRMIWVRLEEAIDLLEKRHKNYKKEATTTKTDTFKIKNELDILRVYYKSQFDKKGI